jgi:hypothetical protein
MRQLVEALKYACRRAKNYRESKDHNRRCDTCHHYSVGRETYCKLFECKVDPEAVCDRFAEPRAGGTQRHRGPSIATMYGLGQKG